MMKKIEGFFLNDSSILHLIAANASAAARLHRVALITDKLFRVNQKCLLTHAIKSRGSQGMAKIQLGKKESGCLDLSKAGELGFSVAYDLIKRYCK